MLRVGFAGTPEFAVPTLEALIRAPEVQVECVYTQPDRPSGRGRKLSESAVKQCAISSNIPLRQPQTLKSTEEIDAFKALQLDAFIVVAYGQILKQDILNHPRLGCLNVHGSILPRWRGAAPLQRAIAAGDTETGITIMKMDAGLDTGPMLSWTTVPITDHTTSGDLHDELAEIGASLLVNTLCELASGRIQPIGQPDVGATYATKIATDDACIDWNQPQSTVMRQIHAYNPAPGAFTFAGNTRLKIYRVDYSDAPEKPAGSLWQAADGSVLVATNDGALKILESQLPGGKRMDQQAMQQQKQAPWHSFATLKKQPE